MVYFVLNESIYINGFNQFVLVFIAFIVIQWQPTVNSDYLKPASFGLIYTCCHDIDIRTFSLSANHRWLQLWRLHISHVRFGHIFLIYALYPVALLRFNCYQLRLSLIYLDIQPEQFIHVTNTSRYPQKPQTKVVHLVRFLMLFGKGIESISFGIGWVSPLITLPHRGHDLFTLFFPLCSC